MSVLEHVVLTIDPSQAEAYEAAFHRARPLIEGQHGFALDIALQGKERFGEAIFDFLAQTSAEAITGEASEA